jgi:hypothetical protein
MCRSGTEVPVFLSLQIRPDDVILVIGRDRVTLVRIDRVDNRESVGIGGDIEECLLNPVNEVLVKSRDDRDGVIRDDGRVGDEDDLVVDVRIFFLQKIPCVFEGERRIGISLENGKDGVVVSTGVQPSDIGFRVDAVIGQKVGGPYETGCRRRVC